MKSNLSDPTPEPVNARAVEIAKVPGLYFLSAPDHPMFKIFFSVTKAMPVSFVWVEGGKIYTVTISKEVKPENIPASVTFTGPFMP